MTSPKLRKAVLEEKRRFWKRHITDWQASELRQAEYCRKYQLKVHRFIYWKKKFQVPEPSSPFIELKLPPVPYFHPSSPTSPLRVAVNRFQVAVDRDFDPITLQQLVYTLEQL